MNSIKVAVIGMGNFTKALMEGVTFYSKNPEIIQGLMNPSIGPYKVSDIEFVAGFDVDARKVGMKMSQAIYMPPNIEIGISKALDTEAIVYRGPTLGSVIQEMRENFVKESSIESVSVAKVLKKVGAEIVINLLPTGANEASYFYAEAALEAGCSFINCIPTPLATSPQWRKRFQKKGLVLLGDDIKSQLGATMLNRALLELMKMRNVKIVRSDQENHGGNTDHFNLLYRAESKEKSKREALAPFLEEGATQPTVRFFYTGKPSGHKLVKIVIEGKIFGNKPILVKAQIEDEISVNGAGVAVDAIRITKCLIDKGNCKKAEDLEAFLMKSPSKPMCDSEAYTVFQNALSTITSQNT